VIRRGFWLTAGAVSGIVAYRRASAVGRQVADRLNLGTARAAGVGVGQQKPLISVRRTRRGAIRAARETYRFTRDVREGMELYMARHSEPAGSTLRTSHDAPPQALGAARPLEALPIHAGPVTAARHDDTKDGH
jgi:hypothetical protein